LKSGVESSIKKTTEYNLPEAFQTALNNIPELKKLLKP